MVAGEPWGRPPAAQEPPLAGDGKSKFDFRTGTNRDELASELFHDNLFLSAKVCRAVSDEGEANTFFYMRQVTYITSNEAPTRVEHDPRSKERFDVAKFRNVGFAAGQSLFKSMAAILKLLGRTVSSAGKKVPGHIGFYEERIWLGLPVEFFAVAIHWAIFALGLLAMSTMEPQPDVTKMTTKWKGSFVLMIFWVFTGFGTLYNLRNLAQSGRWKRDDNPLLPTPRQRMVVVNIARLCFLLGIVALAAGSMCFYQIAGTALGCKQGGCGSIFDRGVCASCNGRRQCNAPKDLCDSDNRGYCYMPWILHFIAAILLTLAVLWMNRNNFGLPKIGCAMDCSRTPSPGKVPEPEFIPRKIKAAEVTLHGPREYGFPISVYLPDKEAEGAIDYIVTLRTSLPFDPHSIKMW